MIRLFFTSQRDSTGYGYVTVDCACGRRHTRIDTKKTPKMPTGKIGVYYICPVNQEAYVVAEVEVKYA